MKESRPSYQSVNAVKKGRLGVWRRCRTTINPTPPALAPTNSPEGAALVLIAIPSRGRASKQVTLRHLKNARLLDSTVLCVPPDEVTVYRRAVDCAVQPVPHAYQGIAGARQWILTE